MKYKRKNKFKKRVHLCRFLCLLWLPFGSTLCRAAWIFSDVWIWPLAVLVPGLPGGSLIQASESCCPCLALGNLTEAWQGEAPNSPADSPSTVQMLGLPQVSHPECRSSERLSIPPWNHTLQRYLGHVWGGSDVLTLAVVLIAYRRGGGHFFSFSALCWLNSLGSLALVPRNAAEGLSTWFVSWTEVHPGDTSHYLSSAWLPGTP